MGELFFKAELLDDIVLSQRTATVGDHKSLDYIPGSVFLGIAASRLYSKMPKDDAWTLFHGSKVRFCNAYPMANETRTIPMPLSFHSEKVPRIGKEQSVLNFTSTEKKEIDVQYKQNRIGYVSIDNDKLDIIYPSKTSRMRTAIDSKTGTASKSQLYGYESLDAGQIFIGKIEWDNSVSTLVEPVSDIFENGEIVHVGRSKTASYGRVKVSRIEIEKNDSKDLCGNSFSILAVSDVCLKNPKSGAPELNITPNFLGLGESWSLDKKRSFSRPVNLFQFNSYRKEIEMQKTLISKGSVFTFESKTEITPQEKETVLEAVKNGIGDGKGQGFGEILLFDPGNEFIKQDLLKVDLTTEQQLSLEEQTWLEWLEPVFLSSKVEDVVKQAVSEFIILCKKIKTANNFDSGYEFWPGNAQWGRLRTAARLCSTKKELYSKVFEDVDCIIKPITISKTEKNADTKEKNPDKEWNYEASPNGETLRKWLMTFISNDNMDDKSIKIALQELVNRCKDKIANPNWLNGGVK